MNRPATPEEQAAINALGQQLNDLADELAEDRRRWWAEFERDKEQWRRDVGEAFAPAHAQLEALREDVRAMIREKEQQRAAELEQRRERRQRLLRRLGFRP